ncbi:hypothetical protein CCR80_03325 [Rhodothalassium salexigens]|uniref:TIGR04282 family arsenosugar biosynthesis glycosyltransferase n=1 Tax=Rhodothalassium salexigens TaxID=1086 RepID=UPI001913C0E9|nr:DUF2064 domain-containing protein [Rhodothalassium salexigens]MBK5920071.1 hypothetical protein [Rhodothalassium salexigens]
MAGAIAILVKTPGLSPVKTRLAADLGAERAEAFFRLSVKAVRSVVAEFLEVRTDWRAYWYVVERKGLKDPLWQDFETRPCGRGDLGLRMARIYHHLCAEHGRAVLLGADTPQLTSAMLHAAWFVMEARARPVIGPAEDGGFYLFGGRMEMPAPVWTETRYSVPETLADLTRRMGAAGVGAPFLLNPLSDVDTLRDLVWAVRQMPPDPTPEQQALIDWVRGLK